MRPLPEAQRGSEARSPARRRVRGAGFALGILSVLLLAATPAAADDYDPQEAGHPVRILAYMVHPIGVILDVLIFRPAHWIGSQKGLDEFFGHEPYDD